MKAFIYLAITLLIPVLVQAESSDRFIKKLKLPSGQTAVIAEGDFEARSIGSFSLRIYDVAGPEDATTFFSSGIIHSRDGTVEKVELEDINNDKKPEIIVTVRSAGSGGYLSAYAFSAEEKNIKLEASVEDLPAKADLISTLRKNQLDK